MYLSDYLEWDHGKPMPPYHPFRMGPKLRKRPQYPPINNQESDREKQHHLPSANDSRKSETTVKPEPLSQWVRNARTIDQERNAGLGTLGYLPFEIRQEIFKLAIGPSPCDQCPGSAKPIMTDFTFSTSELRYLGGCGPRKGTHAVYNNSVHVGFRQLRYAFRKSAFEIDHVFFPLYAFEFSDPQLLINLVSIFQEGAAPKLDLRIKLFGEFCTCQLGNGLVPTCDVEDR